MNQKWDERSGIDNCVWLALALGSTGGIILLHDTSTQDKATSARMPHDDVGASTKAASRPIRISACTYRYDSKGRTAFVTAS